MNPLPLHNRPHLLRQKLLAAIYLAARWYAAFTLLGYGFAKLMGAQFTVLDSVMARPLDQVSPFWLTWYYFGLSPVYSGLIAWTQIAGAVLLCFRRTALLGAVLLAPVILNILGIDAWVIHFPWDSAVMRVALSVALALLVVLAFHAVELWRLFLRRREGPALLPSRWWLLAGQVVLVACMVGYAAHRGRWLANVNNRRPTAIDGAWHVTQIEPETTGFPDWIYLEYNRAYLTVFQFPGGAQVWHDFRVDAARREISIGTHWLRPGTDIFDGSWKRDGNTMVLTGTWHEKTHVRVTLSRKPMPIQDHQSSVSKVRSMNH